MNKFYIIAPAVLLLGFIFYYSGISKEMAADAQAIADTRAAEEARVAAEKVAAEQRAREESERRRLEREAEEARKEAEKRAAWDADTAEINATTAEAKAAAEKLAIEVGQLEIALIETRAAKEKAIRDAFELSREVEMAKIAKRTAELEIQRMTEMVSRRAAESVLTRAPAVATTPTR